MTPQQQRDLVPENRQAVRQSSPLDLWVGMETDPGTVRELNEDYVACFEPADKTQRRNKGSIFLVADGMGGHQAGEVASKMAAEWVMREYYADAERRPGDSLVRAVKVANQALYSEAQADISRQGMGTTMVAAVVLGRRVYVANVGDSRAYLINGQGISRITQDHSWVEEQVQAGLLTREQAEQHPQRNLITRALGHKPSVEVDLFKGEIRSEDTLLLCSDGLCGPVTDQQIAAIAYSQPPPEATRQLVDQAKAQRAEDNISLVIVRAAKPKSRKPAQPDLVEEDATPTAVAARSHRQFLSQVEAWLQPLIAKVPLSAEKRQWLLVGLAVLTLLCCVCGVFVLFPALGQKLVGNPVATPRQAPIGPVDLSREDPGWWATYLGYADSGAMAAQHGALDAESATAAELWPARRGIFVVGRASDWTCQAQSCTFLLKMRGEDYSVSGDQSAFVKDNINLNGKQVRVFGYQAHDGETVSAVLIDRGRSWLAWWLPAWMMIYQDHNWSEPAWVYTTADRNPYGLLPFEDYAGLTRGDWLLLRGKWLAGGSRDNMVFNHESVYRLEGDSYALLAGQSMPAPRPTVTLRP